MAVLCLKPKNRYVNEFKIKEEAIYIYVGGGGVNGKYRRKKMVLERRQERNCLPLNFNGLFNYEIINATDIRNQSFRAQWLLLVYTILKLMISAFGLCSIFMSFVKFTEQKAIILQNNINVLLYVTKRDYVFCEVRT
jgi:hypothetical protein